MSKRSHHGRYFLHCRHGLSPCASDLGPALEGLRFAVQSRTIKVGVVRIPVLTHTYVHITHERSILLAGSRVIGNAVNFVNDARTAIATTVRRAASPFDCRPPGGPPYAG